ncbi:UNVERIFIED_CONTAM: hypothetical protein Slati_3081500 [Sesamum latifolium]|uniref:Uncharacterized protein n=1 Tax=Sesamum latifolium TaxID=2727402 RepID=A0AAW2UWX7_9LAMI
MDITIETDREVRRGDTLLNPISKRYRKAKQFQGRQNKILFYRIICLLEINLEGTTWRLSQLIVAREQLLGKKDVITN